MEALRKYFMHLDFYNRRIARTPITSNYDKIKGASMGLQVFALKTWFTQGLSKHLAKPYTQFKSELICQAVPADFVWTQLAKLHRLRQAPGHDVDTFQEFSDQMRSLQMEIGFQVVSNQEVAKLVLLGTDPELCRILCTHMVSSLAGWSDHSLKKLALDAPVVPTSPEAVEVFSDAHTDQPLEFDYQVFERIGCKEWSVIAQQRQAIATQVSALQQRPMYLRPAAASAAPQVATAAPGHSPITGGPHPVAQLTVDERTYLDQNHGCYRCHTLNADHILRNCPRYLSPMGASATPLMPTSTAPAPRPGPRIVEFHSTTRVQTLQLWAAVCQDRPGFASAPLLQPRAFTAKPPPFSISPRRLRLRGQAARPQSST